MNSKLYDLNKALKELEIRTNNSDQDRQQLNQILFEILGYPSIELAQQHHRANILGCNDLFSRRKQINQEIRSKNVQNLQVCQCCGLLVRNQELPYCIDFDELSIGVGVHLFFKNYTYNAIIFVLMFLIYSIFAIVTNAEFNDVLYDGIMCVLPGSDCGVSHIGAGSKILEPDTEKNRLSRIQSIIGLAFVVLWGILNIVKTHFQRKMIIDMDIKRISAPDFTLMMTHFPKIYLNQSYEDNLQNLNMIFKNYEKQIGSTYNYEVVKYNVGKPLFSQSIHVKQRMQELQKKLKQKQDVFRGWLKYRQDYLQFPVPEHQRNKLYEEYIDFFSTEFDTVTMKQVPLDQKNVVFVTLRDSKAMEEISKNNQPASWKNFWNCFSQSDFPIREVHIRKAPEPQQIKWENIGFSYKSKIFRKILIWLVTFALIGISLGISIGIAYVDQESMNIGISVGISLVVTVVNVGIQLAIMNLSYFQNQYISSVQQTNIAIKIAIGQLLNSIGVPIIVTILSMNDAHIADKSWLKEGGLVHDVFYIALLNIAVPLARFIDPYQILLKIQRWYYEHPQQRLKMYGQKQLNQYYGNYIFDIGYQYAYLIKTSIFTAFFACMQPIIVLFAPFGLMLYFFADKRNLLTHFQRPGYHYPTINKAVDFILLFSPVAFGFGHLLVNNFISQAQGNGTLLLNWIIVIVSAGFLIIVPFQVFYKCIDKPEFPRWDYYEMKPMISSDYDRSNPVTKDTAIPDFQHYLQELEKKQELPDQAQMIKMRVSNIRDTLVNRRDRTDLMKSSLKMSQIKGGSRRGWGGGGQSMDMRNSNPQYNNDLNAYNKYIQNNNKFEISNDRMNPTIPKMQKNSFQNLQDSYKYPDVHGYQKPRRGDEGQF